MITAQSDREKLEALYDQKAKEKLGSLYDQKAKEKLGSLYKKLEEAAEKYRQRLKNFKGVPHESASGELSFSELKVREDFVRSLRDEILALEKKLGVKSKISPRFP